MGRSARWGLTAIATLAVACNSLLGIHERDLIDESSGDSGPDAAVDDGSADDGSADDGSADDGSADDGDADAMSPTDANDIDVPIVTCTSSIVYVSSTGNDANPGCSTDAPKQSIEAAVASVKAQGTAGREIHVCKGTYVEPSGVVVTFPVSLLGGYDCTTWARTATYGYPTFDGTNETVVERSPSASLPNSTIELSGVSLTNAVVVDGFTIQGGTSDTVGSVGVYVTGNAAPKVSNNRIFGGGTSSATGALSTGIRVDTGASPIITGNSIDGGNGQTATSNTGSIGVYLFSTAGSATVQGNTINGGSGVSHCTNCGIASVGLYVQGGGPYTGANAIRDNVVSGGTGTTTYGYPAVGVEILSPTVVDLINNQIDGGRASTGTRGSAGVFSTTSGAVRLLQNRIYGGQTTATGITAYGTVGASLGGTGSVVVWNNMIHGGANSGPGQSPALLLSTSASGSLVQHNTLVAGQSVTAKSAAIEIGSASTVGSKIENNLLGGFQTSTGLLLDACESVGVVATFLNNALFNVNSLLGYGSSVASPCASNATFSTIAALGTELTTRFGSAQVSGDVNVAACATADACFAQMFATWNTMSEGLSDLTTGGGWKLTTTTPCTISQGGLDLTASVPTDLYGTTRTVPVSMGAHEYNGTCQ